MDKQAIKRVFFVIIPIIIVVVLFVYLLSSLQGNVIPADFTAARQSAAAISQDIVNLTSETGKKIESANQAENNGNLDQLRSLISDAKANNTIAYQKAFDLSKSIQQMAESLNGVRSTRQRLGYEAVALELSLVSEFMSYTESLNDFLNNVARSASDENPINRKATADALNRVNQKVNLINDLNRNFVDKMSAFDQAN
jgi:hypothetical protein